jgi:YD repeat-containing protein
MRFVRNYRSGSATILGPLGNGWTFSYAARIDRDGPDIVYSDGTGSKYRFDRRQSSRSWTTPPGLYATVQQKLDTLTIRQRHGVSMQFELPDSGGRLLKIEDRNRNVISFRYGEDVVATDTLGRDVTFHFEHHLLMHVRDYTGRIWRFRFDEKRFLTECHLPAAADFPDGTTLTYAYDATSRLTAMADERGQTYLRNTYDSHNRIVRQEHGTGSYEFRYEEIGDVAAGYPIYRTMLKRKDGSKVFFVHDKTGHVTSRTLLVSTANLSDRGASRRSTGLVQLTTTSAFNRTGELQKRTYPSGRVGQWQWPAGFLSLLLHETNLIRN